MLAFRYPTGSTARDQEVAAPIDFRLVQTGTDAAHARTLGLEVPERTHFGTHHVETSSYLDGPLNTPRPSAVQKVIHKLLRATTPALLGAMRAQCPASCCALLARALASCRS
jgi:hypothetical protein